VKEALDETRHVDALEETLGEEYFAERRTVLRVEFAAASHRGRMRSNNEDQYVVIRRRRHSQVVATSLPATALPELEEESYLLVVADGMGGAAFGEVASELALRTAWQLAGRETSWTLQLNDREAQQIMKKSDAYVQRIHQALREHADARPELAGMGTTLTGVYLLGGEAFVVHVGDSRAYLLRGGELRQLTRDHTLAQDLVDAGVDAARTHAFKHVLTNCLGGDSSEVTTEVHRLPLEHADWLLLCSDGLTDMVGDEEIRELLLQAGPAEQICQALIDRALEHGGRDNVTVVLARVTVPGTTLVEVP
jgi:protein phosphatase